MGFKRIVIPYHNYKSLPESVKQSAQVVGVRTIRKAFEAIVT